MQCILAKSGSAAIIRCIFFLLVIDRGPTTGPANNRQQISVLLEIMIYLCVMETTYICENGIWVPRAVREWFNSFSWSKEQWSNDKTIIELGSRKTSFVGVSPINYLPQPSASANIIDLLASDKSWYFAQSRLTELLPSKNLLITRAFTFVEAW